MTKSITISTKSIKDRLINLEKNMEGQQEIVYTFAKFLAERLNGDLNINGFKMQLELALYDGQRGIDGFTDKPIKYNLEGYPQMIYNLIRIIFTEIIEEEF